MRKTAKSKLLAELEIDTNSVKALPDYSNSSAYIIDFMTILQTAKKVNLQHLVTCQKRSVSKYCLHLNLEILCLLYLIVMI